LSTVFSKLGCDVTIVEMLDDVLPGYANDLSKPVRDRAKEHGVSFNFGEAASAWEEKDEGVVLSTETEDGDTSEYHADSILVAVGREPVTDTLGLGTSTRKAIEDLHGEDFDRPVRRTHEAGELIRAFTRGEGRVDYDGEVFDVADFPALSGDVSVYVAALGEANRRATGRVGDGWLPHNVPFPELEDAFETVADEARDAVRDPDELRVSPSVPCAVSEDPE
ncbi:MAG: LLM class flavin-dependent oxidoreductase, partial [Halobacteriaceae archaeon]